MRFAHLITRTGTLCASTVKPDVDCHGSLQRRLVTCPVCLAILEDRERDDLRWATVRPGAGGRVGRVACDE